MSSLIYYSSKKKLYLRVSFFWLALILNFMVLAVAQNGEAAIIMGYSFTIIPLNLLSYASVFFVGTKYPWKKFLAISLTCTAASFYLVYFTQASFLIKALPLSFATAAPMLYTAHLFLIRKRKECTQLMKCHAVILFAIVLHCFNFAFFRDDPAAQLWGWPVSYAVYQLLAAIIPAMSLDFYHRREKERLTEIISNRTQELHQTNSSLENVIVEKDFLFKTLVHDVSNPLSVILGRIEFYKKTKKDIDKLVTTVDKMALRISSLVAQVKTFEKALDSNEVMEVEKINLLDSLKDVILMFEDKCLSKNIKINFDSKDFEDVYILSERKVFSNSIVPNIINNAIKFSDLDSEISIKIDKKSSAECVLIFKDEGIGIPTNILNELFDINSKTSRLGTSGEKGTGFGLPITKQLVNKSGGKIWVESQTKNASTTSGTTVYISFKASYEPQTKVCDSLAA